MKRVFLTAEWRYLAMLNYAVDPDAVRRYVPSGTELDFFGEKTFVSLVGFRFVRTRLFGHRIPFHQDFDEVNLRFYVRRNDRRGVVFIQEIVPKRAVAAIARLAFNENYIALPMAHRIDAPAEAEYRWRHNRAWNSIRIEAEEPGARPAEGSLEQFITEHYWGYAAQPNKGCLEYEVAHEPWRVWKTISARFKGDAAPLYGAAIATALNREPDSAFLAEGSGVTVYRGRPLLPARRSSEDSGQSIAL